MYVCFVIVYACWPACTKEHTLSNNIHTYDWALYAPAFHVDMCVRVCVCLYILNHTYVYMYMNTTHTAEHTLTHSQVHNIHTGTIGTSASITSFSPTMTKSQRRHATTTATATATRRATATATPTLGPRLRLRTMTRYVSMCVCVFFICAWIAMARYTCIHTYMDDVHEAVGTCVHR